MNMIGDNERNGSDYHLNHNRKSTSNVDQNHYDNNYNDNSNSNIDSANDIQTKNSMNSSNTLGSSSSSSSSNKGDCSKGKHNNNNNNNYNYVNGSQQKSALSSPVPSSSSSSSSSSFFSSSSTNLNQMDLESSIPDDIEGAVEQFLTVREGKRMITPMIEDFVLLLDSSISFFTSFPILPLLTFLLRCSFPEPFLLFLHLLFSSLLVPCLHFRFPFHHSSSCLFFLFLLSSSSFCPSIFSYPTFPSLLFIPTLHFLQFSYLLFAFLFFSSLLFPPFLLLSFTLLLLLEYTLSSIPFPSLFIFFPLACYVSFFFFLFSRLISFPCFSIPSLSSLNVSFSFPLFPLLLLSFLPLLLFRPLLFHFLLSTSLSGQHTQSMR